MSPQLHTQNIIDRVKGVARERGHIGQPNIDLVDTPFAAHVRASLLSTPPQEPPTVAAADTAVVRTSSISNEVAWPEGRKSQTRASADVAWPEASNSKTRAAKDIKQQATRGIAGSGLCGVWTASTSSKCATGNRRQIERYQFRVDGSVDYFREVRSLSGLGKRANGRTDTSSEDFVHELARGVGTITLQGDDTLIISCPNIEIARTTGASCGGATVAARQKSSVSTAESEHLVQITRAVFEEKFSKFVEIPGENIRPSLLLRPPGGHGGTVTSVASRRSPSVLAGGVAVVGLGKAVNAQKPQGAKSERSSHSSEAKRELAKLSIRLGDYAKGRMLLEEVGEVGMATQLLSAARDDKIKKFGADHIDVSRVQSQLDVLGLPQAEGEENTDSRPPIVHKSIERRRLARIDQMESGNEPVPFGGLRTLVSNNHKIEKIQEVFEEWARGIDVADRVGVQVPGVAVGSGAAIGISREAFGKKLSHLRPLMTEEDIDHVFRAADANKDGVIDYLEFVEWLLECRSLHDDVLGQRQQQQCGTALAPAADLRRIFLKNAA